MENTTKDMLVKRHKKSEKMEGFIARMYDRNARMFQMGIYNMYLKSVKRHIADV
jgi:hypothetical protein